MELAIEPAVFDGGRRLTGDGRQQVHVFAGQRLAGLPPAEREHGVDAIIRDARHEVVDAGVAPELDFFGRETADRQRIVEPHGVAIGQPAADAGRRRQPREHAVEARDAHGLEVPGLAGRHQRHAIDDERFLDPRDQPIGQPIEVEIAVEVARKRHQRAAVVVAIAIERAIDRRLHRLLDRLGQQQDDHRRQKRDQPAMLVFSLDEEAARRPQDEHVDCRDRREDGGVDEQALQDDLDVHQSVANDGRGKRQRNERERNRQQLHRERRLHAEEHERHRVAEREGQHTQRGAPDNPPQLPGRT